MKSRLIGEVALRSKVRTEASARPMLTLALTDTASPPACQGPSIAFHYLNRGQAERLPARRATCLHIDFPGTPKYFCKLRFRNLCDFFSDVILSERNKFTAEILARGRKKDVSGWRLRVDLLEKRA